MFTTRRALSSMALIILGSMRVALASAADLEWPPVTRETRPWTRWWWLGSSVEKGTLTSSLEAYRDVGLGGVEITPIYGVVGDEAGFVPYLSPAWLDHLRHTLTEAQRLDLGVDMATGTGWPFGGPWVPTEMAAKTLAHKSFSVAGGQRLEEPIRFRQEPLVRAVGNPRLRGETGAPDIQKLAQPVEANTNLQALALDQVKYPRDLPLVTLVATSDSGTVQDLTARVGRDGTLDWIAPAGQWKLHALFVGDHGKMVERAAPGGEGNVIDHFSAGAIRSYLDRFDSAFAGQDLGGLRAFFNDSYEVDDATGQADWTPGFLDEFARRRGYDLRQHLPALLGEDVPDKNTRVLVDYRETISDLLLDTFTREWRAWAMGRGALARNQAHGSPANILDLYAATDIPETEGDEIMRMKWATSAAHVSGKRLASAEVATWLGEHFLSTLADVRKAVDLSFLSGVNHVFYHGTAYSPPADPWPGRLFYASVEFTPSNPWWTDFGALNRYVTRVQSFLQQGSPDNDVLLYFPFHEAIAVRGRGRLEHFGDARLALENARFGEAARALQAQGFGFDFVSDRQLQDVQAAGGQLLTGGAAYQTVLVPSSREIPLSTLERLLALVRDGANVIAFGPLAEDVSGFADLGTRRAALRRQLLEIRFGEPGADGVREARLGRGALWQADTLPPLLARARARRESMIDQGLEFTRRRQGEDRVYFVVNRSAAAVDGWVPLAAGGQSVGVFDPMQGEQGYGRSRNGVGGALEVYLQIAAGESILLVAKGASPGQQRYPYWKDKPPAQKIEGSWSVQFEEGGLARPLTLNTSTLASWTTLDAEAVGSFSGTASYSISFPRPRVTAPAYALDLGEVHASARVRLNGRELGTLIGPRFRLVIDSTRFAETNRLEVVVTNLMANRIAALDRQKLPWKKFYNVNFPARLPANRGQDGLFHADHWTPLPSGLLGPVTLVPLEDSSQAGVSVGYCTDDLEAARDAGFDYAELGVRTFTALSEDGFRAFLERHNAVGLPTPVGYLFLPTDLKVVGPATDEAREMAYVRKAFARAQALGIDTIVFGSGPARTVPEGFPREKAFAQLVAFVKRIAPEAKARGIVLSVEAQRPEETNLINSTAEAITWVSAVDHPNFQVMVDFYHLASVREDPKVLRKAGRIAHVHFANPTGRVFPRDATEYDYSGFFENLRQTSHPGRFSIEARTTNLGVDGPRAIAFLRQAAGRRPGASARGGHRDARQAGPSFPR